MQKNSAVRTKKQFFVGSEIGQLKKVILHRPELSLDRLTPSNCRDFLFDDIVRVEKACSEHAAFEKALEDHGVQCYLLRNLLEKTLEINDAKRWILDRQVSEYRYGVSIAQEIRSYFSQLNAKDMTLHLTGGLAQDELKLSKSNPALGGLKDTDFLMDPLPNHLFTRGCYALSLVSTFSGEK
jgi:arginine deiminase